MTRVGLLSPGSDGTATVGRAAAATRDRIRRGARPPDRAAGGAPDLRGGSRRARPARAGRRCAAIVDALDAAFYTAFENVEPTGKRLLLALDVSGSMDGGEVAGVPGLTPAGRVGGDGARHRGDRDSGTSSSASSPAGRLEVRSRAVGRRHRRPDAARDLARGSGSTTWCRRSATCRSAAPTARCRCCTR